MNMRRPPGVDMVTKRVGTGLDGTERIVSVLVGDHAAAAAEIWIDRGKISIILVPVSSAGVGLPHLDQRVGNAAAVFVHDSAVNDGAFADRFACLGIIQDHVMIER